MYTVNSSLTNILVTGQLYLACRLLSVLINLVHPYPDLCPYDILLSLWCFCILLNYYCQFDGNFVRGQGN